MGHVPGAENLIFYIRDIDDATKTHPRMSRAVPSGRREGMFPGLYSKICGRGDRLGCILNLGHSFDAIEAYL